MDDPAGIAIRLTDEVDPALVAALERALDHSEPDAPPRHDDGFSVEARDDAGILVGGLVARIAWRWLHVELLWVDAAARSRGIGSRLLAAAEDRARALGCDRAYLSTLAWQAPDFYRRCGYRPFAELPSFAGGHARFWLAKPLTVAAGAPLSHRIRAAALVFRGDALLLVEHRDPARGISWWSPPGGGVEGDESFADCAARETREETGLEVTIGRLAYVQDLLVPEMGRRNAEFFFLADDPCGDLRPERTLHGGRSRVAFLDRAEVQAATVLPRFLTTVLWEDRAAGFPSVRTFADSTAD